MAQSEQVIDLSSLPTKRQKVKTRDGEYFYLRSVDELDFQTLIGFKSKAEEIQEAVKSGDVGRAAELDAVIDEVMKKLVVCDINGRGPAEDLIQVLTRGEKVFLIKSVFEKLGGESRTEPEISGEKSPDSADSTAPMSATG